MVDSLRKITSLPTLAVVKIFSLFVNTTYRIFQLRTKETRRNNTAKEDKCIRESNAGL